MNSGTRLDPDRDLDIALLTSAEMNRIIVAADAKAGLVLAVQGVVVAGLVSSLRSGPPLSTAARLGSVAVLVMAGIVVALLVATLWPRLKSPAAAWFAFPGLRIAADDVVPARPASTVLAEQAWVQAGALAAIARRKYRWFRAALAAVTVDLVIFAIWVALVSTR